MNQLRWIFDTPGRSEQLQRQRYRVLALGALLTTAGIALLVTPAEFLPLP